MAIVKATYTKSRSGARASIRYMQHRPGNEDKRMTRTLFGIDGAMGRYEAYRIIDEAEKGSIFFRFIISPDPSGEDSEKDLHLRDVTEKTMQSLEERVKQTISWVAVEHDDHAPHRHVHIMAVIQGRLQVQDFQTMRQSATEVCQQQRQELDRVKTQQQEREEAVWEQGY